MVDGVREELGLQAEAPPLAVGGVPLPRGTAVQIVACVELYAGHGGAHRQNDPRLLRPGPGRRAQRPRRAVHHPVVVIAPRHGQLGEVLVDPRADPHPRPQVHGGALHRGQLPRGDGAPVRGGIAPGVDLDILAGHRTAGVSVQIEIAVVGEIAQGVPAAPRPVGDGQPLRGEGIGHPDRQVAGVALLAVRAEQGEDQPVRPRLLHLPHLPVKACQAAVDVVFPVVGRQGILPVTLAQLAPTSFTRPTRAPRYLSCRR